MSPAIDHRGKGGFSRRGRPWIWATSQWLWSIVSIASADARCSRLPHKSTEPRKPRKTALVKMTSRVSGHQRRGAAASRAAEVSVGMRLLLERFLGLRRRADSAQRAAGLRRRPNIRRQINRNGHFGQGMPEAGSTFHHIDNGGDVFHGTMSETRIRPTSRSSTTTGTNWSGAKSWRCW